MGQIERWSTVLERASEVASKRDVALMTPVPLDLPSDVVARLRNVVDAVRQQIIQRSPFLPEEFGTDIGPIDPRIPQAGFLEAFRAFNNAELVDNEDVGDVDKAKYRVQLSYVGLRGIANGFPEKETTKHMVENAYKPLLVVTQVFAEKSDAPVDDLIEKFQQVIYPESKEIQVTIHQDRSKIDQALEEITKGEETAYSFSSDVSHLEQITAALRSRVELYKHKVKGEPPSDHRFVSARKLNAESQFRKTISVFETMNRNAGLAGRNITSVSLRRRDLRVLEEEFVNHDSFGHDEVMLDLLFAFLGDIPIGDRYVDGLMDRIAERMPAAQTVDPTDD